MICGWSYSLVVKKPPEGGSNHEIIWEVAGSVEFTRWVWYGGCGIWVQHD